MLKLGGYGGAFLGCISLFIAGRWALMRLMLVGRLVKERFATVFGKTWEHTSASVCDGPFFAAAAYDIFAWDGV